MKKAHLILIILISTQCLSGQQKIYDQEDVDFFSSNKLKPETLNEFKMILESNKDLIGWIAYYRQKIYVHLAKNQNDSVLLYGNKALRHLEHLKSRKMSKKAFKREECGVKQICLYMAIVLSYEKKYRESTQHLLRAKKLIAKYPNYQPINHPYIYGYLASNFLEMGDKEEALKHRLIVSKDSVYMSKSKGAAVTYSQLGLLYKILNRTDSVVYYFKKSIENRVKINDYAGIRSAYNNIGDVFKKQKNIDSALFYYKKSKMLLKKYPNQNYGYSKYFTMANYGYVLLHEGKVDQAITRINRVLDSIRDISKINTDVKNLKIMVFDYLIEAYQKNNQLNQALKVSEQKAEVFEKYHQQVLDEKLRELNIAYEVKEKEESIQQLLSTTKEQNIIIKQRNFIALVLVGILLLIFGIGFLVFRQRKLENKYKTANLEQRLLRSQLNPHFIFNALNTVSSLAHKKSENTSYYIAKLSSLIRLILKNSREEFVSLDDELKSIEDYLELQSNFLQKFKYQITVQGKIDKEETYIPPMFIQPFIENSIEHGLRDVDDGNISIDIKMNQKDKLLQCKIIDNGIGVIKALEFKSKGGVGYESFSGKILKERLQIYSKSLNKKAKYRISPLHKKEGTEVNVSLPYILE